MDIKLKHLVSDRDRHGNRRFYVRVKGRPKVRMKEAPGSPAFLQAYERALAGDKTGAVIAKGTLAALARAYMSSASFKALDGKSQASRRGVLESCLMEPLKPGAAETFGECPVARFTAQHGRVLRERKAGLPGAANNRIKWLSTMFSWAVENNEAAVNPMRDVQRVKNKTEGFHTWTLEEVAKFCERHPRGSMAELAMALMLFTGARRSDAILLGRQHIRDEVLTFKPRKTRKSTGVTLRLPVLPVLRSVIDASPCGDLTFLLTSFGKPFASGNAFGNWFRDRCDEAGLPHCTAHGLRKAGATLAAMNGATDRQLMAVYGWASADEASTYTRMAEQHRLAGTAMPLLRLD